MRKLWTGITLAMLVAATGAAACVDTEDGESGTYNTPCFTVFGDLLLCGRESGGMDPLTPTDGPFTCADACQLFVDCGYMDPSEVAECIAECVEYWGPALLECFRQHGCNLEPCLGDYQ